MEMSEFSGIAIGAPLGPVDIGLAGEPSRSVATRSKLELQTSSLDVPWPLSGEVAEYSKEESKDESFRFVATTASVHDSVRCFRAANSDCF